MKLIHPQHEQTYRDGAGDCDCGGIDGDVMCFSADETHSAGDPSSQDTLAGADNAARALVCGTSRKNARAWIVL